MFQKSGTFPNSPFLSLILAMLGFPTFGPDIRSAPQVPTGHVADLMLAQHKQQGFLCSSSMSSPGQLQDLQLVYPMSLSFKNKMVSYRIISTFLQIIICHLKYQLLLTTTLLCYRIYNYMYSPDKTRMDSDHKTNTYYF